MRSVAGGIALLALGCARTLVAPDVSPELVEDRRRADATGAFSAYRSGAARVVGLASRLLVANHEQCGDEVVPYVGWFALSRREVGRELRELAVAELGLADSPVVVALAPGAPAAAAGVEVGDAIVAIDGRTVRTSDPLRRRVAAHPAGAIPFSVRRGAETFELSAEPARACSLRVQLSAGDELRIFSWQLDLMSLSLGLLETGTDDELAYLIAYELAQQLRGDVPPDEEPGELALAHSAVDFALRAGFRVDGIERLLELVAREHPWEIVKEDASGDRNVAPRGARRYPAVVGPLPKRIVALRTARAQSSASPTSDPPDAPPR